MSAQHTQGPWRLDQDENKEVDAHYHCIQAGCGYYDEKGEQRGFSITGFMSVADARLMTASPEMLDALEQALEFVADHEDVSDGDTGPVPNRAMSLATELRAIIAKAGGRA
jgi:hypothetical protein